MNAKAEYVAEVVVLEIRLLPDVLAIVYFTNFFFLPLHTTSLRVSLPSRKVLQIYWWCWKCYLVFIYLKYTSTEAVSIDRVQVPADHWSRFLLLCWQMRHMNLLRLFRNQFLSYIRICVKQVKAPVFRIRKDNFRIRIQLWRESRIWIHLNRYFRILFRSKSNFFTKSKKNFYWNHIELLKVPKHENGQSELF